jgi:diguanylate cyclase (GGDEF)-like protein
MPDRQSRPLGQGRDATMRRHTRSLLVLAQRLWASGCGLEPALAAITETAANVLDVESVRVWQLGAGGQLRCVHSYQRGANAHNGPGFDEALPFPPRDRGRRKRFLQPRVIRTEDLAESAQDADGSGPLVHYLARHGIKSLIDAPIRVDGELYGTICHEQIGAHRTWRRDEIAFAGKIGEIVALALEVERRKRAEARLEFLELHDSVTGLADRTMLHGAIRHLLRRQQTKPRLAALMFIDVDHFYSVNESIGEQGGNRVLTEMGERINLATPDEAIIARVESDCFAVLLPRVGSEWQAVRQAADILGALSAPVQMDALEFNVSVSIGIAFSTGASETTPEVLLRDADLASKQAKLQGRNRYQVFDPEQHLGLLDRLRIERGLRRSLVDGSLEVAYQPEIDLATGSVRGAEALLRWRDGDGGLRAAADFIDVAETSGLIVPIGRWVLQQACTDAKAWPPTQDGSACTLAVNLSARQFEQPGLVEMVRDVLAHTGYDPGHLCLEITESTLMSRAQSALDTLHGLKALGVTLAVDDFGTGYSSLAYLKRFPVDLLKIDKSMVDGLPADPNARIIIGAVIGLAHAMGLEVVVEGVELESQQAELLGLGCRRAQGWLYSKAESNAEFVARMTPAAG